MAVRPVIRGSAADLMGQQNAAATARFRQPPRPPSSAPASFSTTGPPPPPRPTPVQARTLPSYGSANATNAMGRPVATNALGPQYAMAGQARTLPAPAYANANRNPNGSYMWGDAAMSPPGPQMTTGQAMANDRRIATGGGVTAQDMVDVPGFGQMPRQLLQNLQQRMQQRVTTGMQGMPNQQAVQGYAAQAQNQLRGQQGPTPDQVNAWDAANNPREMQDRVNAMMASGDRAGANALAQQHIAGLRQSFQDQFGMPLEQWRQMQQRQGPQQPGPSVSLPTPGPKGPQPPIDWANMQQTGGPYVPPRFPPGGGARPNDNRFGPPVSGQPVVDQGAMWGARPGNPATPPVPGGPFSSYGNDNIGVGVTPPTMISQPPAAQPPVMNPAPPAPPPPPPSMNTAPAAINPSLLHASSPEIASLGQYQMMTPGATPADFAAYQAAYRNRAMTGPGGPPPPPGGYNSPFLPHVAGGGFEGMGAGRNPAVTSMTDFYGAFGNGRPGQPLPTGQQIYDQFNANANPNPYQTTGPANMWGPMQTQPSYY